ncbi:class I SAM-dependent methyltransferase [Gottfriedia sp. S16(2024)]|uniref:class I SAM-dependent methyltransferase n=1 Tax=Gottfriedia sp. S16(2024) TaxID=3162883 RepID=UPI003D1F04E1
MDNWIFHSPIFEFDGTKPTIRQHSAWKGHAKFAYDLVQFVKPKKIVELGTHFGFSFFCFCQSVKDHNLSCECFAVDTWQGDLHSGLYSNEVFDTVREVVQKHYQKEAKMLRNSFDEAIKNFEDHTIDILHIDGFHTFEAVLHDYTTWLSKVSKEGIVLIHDTEVRIQDFGVYKFWEGIKQQLPSFEFTHSHGLGVLFPKGCNEKFKSVFSDLANLQNHYSKE